MRRRATRIGIAAALAGGVMLGASPVVVAHSSLVGSTPEDGAVLAESPDEIVLEFDEDVQPDFSQVAVLDADENHYEDGEPESVGPTVTQAVTELPAGDYSVSYRVGSTDGHPVTGVVSFTVEPPATDEATLDDEGMDDATGADATEPAVSDEASDASAAGDTADEDGTPMSTVVATMAAVAVVAIAAVLLMRRRPGSGDGDSPPDGQ